MLDILYWIFFGAIIGFIADLIDKKHSGGLVTGWVKRTEERTERSDSGIFVLKSVHHKRHVHGKYAEILSCGNL